VFDDNNVERQLRLELDLVKRLEVGRVGDRYREPVAALAQRQNTGSRDELPIDDVARQLTEVDGRQVQ